MTLVARGVEAESIGGRKDVREAARSVGVDKATASCGECCGSVNAVGNLVESSLALVLSALQGHGS